MKKTKKKANAGLPIDPRLKNAYGMAYNRELDLDEMDVMKHTNSQRIQPNFYEKMVPNFTADLPQPYPRKRSRVPGLIAPALTLVDALIPGDPIDRYPVVQPGRSYNANPYGTGSQAIMKSGGKIKKAVAGSTVGDPPGPVNSLLNTRLAESVGYSLVNGTDHPLTHTNGKFLFNELVSQYGLQNAQNFITDLSLFNQDAGNKSLSQEERVRRFYKTSDRTGIKTALMGNNPDPALLYRSATDVNAQQLQGKGLLVNNASMKAGGSVKKKGYNYFDGGTIEFNGPSHEEGGIPISYGGKQVEVEGGETGVIAPDGTLNIMGNMKIPGTKTKFKSASKKIAEQEEKYTAILDKGTELVNTKDPESKWDRLAFNSGAVMMSGGKNGLADLSQKKMLLASIQNEMLMQADELGLDPISFSEGGKKKAKAGASIKAAAGTSVDNGGGKKKKKDSVAVRHNNPGNIKFGEFAKKLGAVQGEPATDGGYFAKFPDVGTGLKALKSLLKTKNYKNLSVDDAIKRWTNQAGYNLPLGELAGRKISDLSDAQFNKLVDTITMGEDGKYYGQDQPLVESPNVDYNDVILPNRTVSAEQERANPRIGATPDDLGSVQVPEDRAMPTNIQPLSMTQVLPELLSFATNKERPVHLQQTTPELYQDYEVSLQDRRNLNTSTFNAVQRSLGTNPTALSSLAAQKYEADNQVNAEEFRINQGIGNQVINQNIQLLNQAELQNLQMADQQFVRQSTANSKTRQQNQLILNSLSSKYLQNRLENTRLSVYENMYDFRYADRDGNNIIDKATYEGPDAVLRDGTGALITNNTNAYSSTMQEYDQFGNLKRTRVRTPSAALQEEQQLKNTERRRRIPLLRQFNMGF